MAKRLLLLVDDAPDIGAVVDVLARRAGWAVAQRHDVAGGWDYLRGRRPDLVLLDMNLPGLRGAELARKVRAADPPLSDLPVALFGHPELTGDLAEALEAGADYFISKELVGRPGEWQLRVGEILSRPHGRPRPPVLRWAFAPPPPAEWAAAVKRALDLRPVRSLGPEVLRAVLRKALAHAVPDVTAAARDGWLQADDGFFEPGRVSSTVCPEALAALTASAGDQVWCLLGGAAAAAFRAALVKSLPGLAENRSP